MKISVVIITGNEEDRIRPALESSAPIADEIVVLDSGSTDRTVEIAREFGARVFSHPFEDYGSQKNLAVSKASHEWVLNLDADERISDPLREEILDWKAKTEEAADGFRIRRKSFYLGRWIRHSGWYPERKLRLFRREKGRWQGCIHERLVLEGTVSRMNGEILHFTYRHITDHIARVNRYTSFQAEEIVRRGEKLLFLRALILPPVTFFRHYVWRAGFLDRFPGLVIALVSSWTTCLKYIKAVERKRNGKRGS